MAETFQRAEVRPPAEGAPIVIHCSDARFQLHFQDFLRTALGLDHYALIAVPGGPQVLTVLDFLPKFSWVGWRWMKFMVDLTRAQHVILIVHDDCRWYQQRLFCHEPARIPEQMIDDARRVRASLIERFGQRNVEIYRARLAGARAIFDLLPNTTAGLAMELHKRPFR
jgi:hypothetical protein